MDDHFECQNVKVFTPAQRMRPSNIGKSLMKQYHKLDAGLDVQIGRHRDSGSYILKRDEGILRGLSEKACSKTTAAIAMGATVFNGEPECLVLGTRLLAGWSVKNRAKVDVVLMISQMYVSQLHSVTEKFRGWLHQMSKCRLA